MQRLASVCQSSEFTCKIPASAVEMPGHIMPQLDVQFGVDFGAETAATFSSGSAEVIQQNYANTVPSNVPGMNNHIGQQGQSNSPESLLTSLTSQLTLDNSSPRAVFQNPNYSAPPRNETASPLSQSSKITPPDPIAFPPSQSDWKSNPLVGPQTGATLYQAKAPPNLPPGVPLLGTHQYIMSQGSIPPFFLSNPSNIQQPLYNYEDIVLQQQQLQPLASSYYDMPAFPVPSTIAGREQATLGSVPYSVGTTDSNKLAQVEAQSPNPTSQQQSTHSGQQPFFNLPYGYYYPSMLPWTAAGFQYPQMFPMPPVTNAAPHAGTTATTQFQKTYASHGYTTTKGYDDLTPTPDFSKSPYGISGTQSKPTGGTRTATPADLTATYDKSNAQALDVQAFIAEDSAINLVIFVPPFDQQAFHAGTPPPFNLPLANATQVGAMGAATYGAPYVAMMPHQTHSQMLHHALQQDSTGASTRVSQQATSQNKVGSKPYGSYGWSA